MADDEPIFESCWADEPKIEPPDPDPMAEFSARYHLEKERRRVKLEKKYGIGTYFALEEEMERRELEGAGSQAWNPFTEGDQWD